MNKQTYDKNCLRISSWNINGFTSKGYNKFHDSEFVNNLIDQDIFCIQETHCDINNCLQITGFSSPVHLLRSRLKNKGKTSGGLSVYVRDNIKSGTKFLKHSTNDFIWLELNKSFFGLPENIYIYALHTIHLKIRPIVKE